VFNSNISRTKYLIYSSFLYALEIGVISVCTLAIMSNPFGSASMPALGGEGFSLAILISLLVFTVIRSNWAWRRTRDAGSSFWVMGLYIAFLTFGAFVGYYEMLTIETAKPASKHYVLILGIVELILWVLLLLPESADTSDDFDFDGDMPQLSPSAVLPPEPQPSRQVSPAVSRSPVFGKRVG
jgi:uncharacterized membrane protein YhaH (DUF805 family)